MDLSQSKLVMSTPVALQIGDCVYYVPAVDNEEQQLQPFLSERPDERQKVQCNLKPRSHCVRRRTSTQDTADAKSYTTIRLPSAIQRRT